MIPHSRPKERRARSGIVYVRELERDGLEVRASSLMIAAVGFTQCMCRVLTHTSTAFLSSSEAHFSTLCDPGSKRVSSDFSCSKVILQIAVHEGAFNMNYHILPPLQITHTPADRASLGYYSC